MEALQDQMEAPFHHHVVLDVIQPQTREQEEFPCNASHEKSSNKFLQSDKWQIKRQATAATRKETGTSQCFISLDFLSLSPLTSPSP